jgi:glycosyltransferase involved in cell wall biosynthesis
MKLSIITPTIARPSLARCRESVQSQTFTDWEHIVVVDSPRSNNFGNTPRHNGWREATGDWVFYLDDDNYLAHPNALRDVAEALEGIQEQWAIFPIMRHGSRFFNDPPGLCMTDTANMVIRREIARWPNIPDYTADGILCEQLRTKYPYAAFPNVSPIVVMEKSSEGK